MATIVVRDLNQSVELDMKAMRAITGGGSGSNFGVSRHRSDLFRQPLSFIDFKPISFDFTIK